MGNIIAGALFQPPPPSYSADAEGVVYIPSFDGNNIALVFYTFPSAKYTILFAHGNAEDMNMGGNFYYKLAKFLNVNLLLFDYPGYGQSTGAPSEESAYVATLSAYDYLITEKGFDPTTIIAFGRSLGSALMTRLAAVETLAGLIIQSPPMSAFRVIANLRFSLPKDSIRSIDAVCGIKFK
eukprot:Gregarina_sp_Poly_1__2760@NODE_1767_length_3378_cov_135_711568_g1153_i0_p2_GENE_NODE_1767_length_3378_cov_135_711568_g1153_i0NODE_1767_length_3378_cov_135_711568_g1153_i0_p2_ORF_typecomplete_len181_score20_18DUF818/PF05677_12/5_1e27Hydrolase_4/PF12146_8/3_2e14DUF1100/PF06500_11/1_6e12Abhydrolase_6/PF12697_7/1_2e09DUF1057/PF06342_12/4_5e07Abhydrolase_1/PF00561_20/3e06Peptidase_S9/PF00326_21/0_00045Abhydrolase_3/PF07859_13/0_00044AXE1/PF05448_12/0_00067Peptidase_S15/PF02129_18/0_0011Abhydrolase_7/